MSSASLVSDSQGRTGAMRGRIRSLTGIQVSGPAFTVVIAPGTNATVHRAVYAAPPSSVLVIDGAGYADRAVWGEVLTVAAQQRGIAGLVLDGAVRDIEAMRERHFPVFAVGTNPAGPHKEPPGQIDIPISCGGVVVRPGDLVVGDEDGVVVVPASDVEEVLADAEARKHREDSWMAALEAGATTIELLGLDGQRG